MRSAVASSVGLQTLDPTTGSLSRSVALELASSLRPHLGSTALSLEVVADRTAGAAALETAWTERRHAAFVLHDLLLDDARMRAAVRVGAPVVAVTPPGVGTAGVTDPVWFAGQAEASVGRYLTDLGHRRFALLVDDARTDVVRALHEGLLDATAGLRATVEVVEVSGAPEAGAAAGRLLARPDRPTALVTDGDVSALAVLESARHRGFQVPWDVSVVAGSDAETCRLVDPQLTAVSRPWRALAPWVAAALDLGSRPEPDEPAETPPPPAARLVIRGTTAPPPTS
jgi:DNA-binding LacI/PurR family transcriptional regulator